MKWGDFKSMHVGLSVRSTCTRGHSAGYKGVYRGPLLSMSVQSAKLSEIHVDAKQALL